MTKQDAMSILNPVTSSAICGLGVETLNPDRITVLMQFWANNLTIYRMVLPYEIGQVFLAVVSTGKGIGAYYNQNIKGRYPCEIAANI